MRLREAARTFTPGLEVVFFNAQYEFTLQYPLLLAPLTPDDTQAIVDQKVRIVGTAIDILLARRLWNFKLIAYSTMQYAMFVVMKDIRRKAPRELIQVLHQTLANEGHTFASNPRLRVHQQNRNAIHQLLARMTDYIERESGLPSRFTEYVSEGRTRHEVEHIWANHADRHTDEFQSAADFDEYRNRIGGLLLLPKLFNGSYGDLPYVQKLPHYFAQNLLAKSLNSQCYERNPGFLGFRERSGLPFHAHDEFKKADLDARHDLYRQIAEVVWNPDRLDRELTS